MDTMAFQITSPAIVYSTVYSDVDQRKHQSSASLAFARGIHRRPVNSPHKWPVTRKMFHLMTSSWIHSRVVHRDQHFYFKLESHISINKMVIVVGDYLQPDFFLIKRLLQKRGNVCCEMFVFGYRNFTVMISRYIYWCLTNKYIHINIYK